jgi:hypothetical protein
MEERFIADYLAAQAKGALPVEGRDGHDATASKREANQKRRENTLTESGRTTRHAIIAKSL